MSSDHKSDLLAFDEQFVDCKSYVDDDDDDEDVSDEYLPANEYFEALIPSTQRQNETTNGMAVEIMRAATPPKLHESTPEVSKTRRAAATSEAERCEGYGEDKGLTMTPYKDVKKSSKDEACVTSQELAQVLKYSQLDMNRIKKEMELKWNACLLAKTKEWDKKQAALAKENAELKKSELHKKTLLDEYVKRISQVLTEKENASTVYQTAVKERDEAVEDQLSVEAALSLLQQRFSKTKTILAAQKQNEEILMSTISRCQADIKARHESCNAIIKQTDDKLDQAKILMENMKKSSASDIAHLDAALKKKTVEYQTLEKKHEQKITENKELVSICDELIKKMGDNS